MVTSQPTTVIADVAVVDVQAGLVRDHQNVVVREGQIVVVEAATPHSPDAATIDGTGKYLIPGLFDCHVHVAFNGFLNIQPDYRKTFAQYLLQGVTQVVDFFTVGGDFPGSSPETIRDDVNSGKVLGPWMLTSYGCLNAPGGFCSCSVGDAASVVVTTDDVAREVARIDTVNPDFIKIVYDDVFGTLPNLTPEILKSLIDQAHGLGYRVAVHIASLQDAMTALDFGAEILGHAIVDPTPPADLRKMADAGVIMIPTLASYEARSVRRNRIALPPYSPQESVLEYGRHTQSIYERQGKIDLYRTAFSRATENIASMVAAGVRVVAGSDSGTWYTFPGDALHRELAIYQEAGLDNTTILRMATADAADAFNLSDRFGTVEPGKEASLVLLGTNPIQDIHATRDVELVMLRGTVLDLDQLRQAISAPVSPEHDITVAEMCCPHHYRPERVSR